MKSKGDGMKVQAKRAKNPDLYAALRELARTAGPNRFDNLTRRTQDLLAEYGLTYDTFTRTWRRQAEERIKYRRRIRRFEAIQTTKRRNEPLK